MASTIKNGDPAGNWHRVPQSFTDPAIARALPESVRDGALRTRIRSPGAGLERHGQYGGELFEAASRYLQGVASSSGRARLRQTVRLRGFASSVRLVARLERLTVSPTDSPSGRAIRAYLEEHRFGIPTHRIAQGVLVVPRSRQLYLRGHHRQAVRTNLHRAQAERLSCAQLTSFPQRAAVLDRMGAEFDEWWRNMLADHPESSWWAVSDRRGRPIGLGVVSVDSDVALIWALVCRRSHSARWLLHTEIVGELAERGVTRLITAASMAPVMAPGSQYFQRLLGYRVAHLKLR